MSETLLTPSSIKLFGRLMTGITFTNNTTPFGGNFFLQRQLSVNTTVVFTTTVSQGANTLSLPANTLGLTAGMSLKQTNPNPKYIYDGTIVTGVDITSNPNTISVFPPVSADGDDVEFEATISPQLARIYSFSFEGSYYALPKPPVFLIHGPGLPVGSWDLPSTTDQSGVAAREWDFSNRSSASRPAGPNDIVYWEYEKGDFSLRLDLEAGSFEQILLQMALRSSPGVSGAGVSGAGVSGAGVSGAGVSGAGVSGAGVSGAGVSGAGLRR